MNYHHQIMNHLSSIYNVIYELYTISLRTLRHLTTKNHASSILSYIHRIIKCHIISWCMLYLLTIIKIHLTACHYHYHLSLIPCHLNIIRFYQNKSNSNLNMNPISKLWAIISYKISYYSTLGFQINCSVKYYNWIGKKTSVSLLKHDEASF